MRLNGEYSPKKYTRKFGSWNKALSAAGYEPRTKHQPITQSELLRALESIADKLGRSPSQSDINDHTEHSHKTYYCKFDGGLEEAKNRLGLEHYEQQSKERVTVRCANCKLEIEKTPSELSGTEYQYCSHDCFHEHKKMRYRGRGNPQSTLQSVSCEACGKNIDRPRWKRQKNDRHYCTGCWGDAKVSIECEQCGEMVAVTPAIEEKRRFCSVDCHGQWISENVTGENHPRWRGGYEGYYGPNWHLQRRKTIIRDQARCQECGLTESESVTRFGEGLSVHHISPVREFITDGELNYKGANRLENLVALCRPCHSRRESRVQ